MKPRRTGPIGRRSGDQIDPPKVLTAAEEQAIEKTLKNRWSGEKKPRDGADVAAFREYLIFELLCATALRRSELCHLRLKDTPDWLGCPVLFIWQAKFGKDRWIPLSNRLAGLLNIYIKNYRPQTLPRHVRRGNGERPLFYSSQHIPLPPNSLYYAVVRWARQAGIKKHITPHKFRHTCATQNLTDIGTGPLRHILGHKHLQTMEKYEHFVIARQSWLGELLDRHGKGKKHLPGQQCMPYF